MDELENAEQLTEGTAELGLTEQADATPEDSAASTAAPEPEIEIERNGQVIRVPFNQAKDYVSKGYDYTQKTQELARERDALKPYQEMATYLQSNPDKAQAIYNLLAQEQVQGVDPVQQKIQQLEYTTQQLIQQNSQERLNSMLNSLNSDEKYKGMFKDKEMEEILLATALQLKKYNEAGLREVADRIHGKFLKTQVEAEKAGEKKVISNLSSPTRKGETGTGSFTPPKGFDPSKASWKEINQRAVEML